MSNDYLECVIEEANQNIVTECPVTDDMINLDSILFFIKFKETFDKAKLRIRKS